MSNSSPGPGTSWSIADAVATYNVDRWGIGYLSVAADGHLLVHPNQDPNEHIDLMRVVAEAKERGLGFPLLVRFQDLLRHRVRTVNLAFRNAIQELGYGAGYQGVFPIKVNQLREVVEEIVDSGREFEFGLEAGSKPELMAALAIHDSPEALIVCNGYKDAEFIRLALLGLRLGKRVVLVIEKLEELHQILRIAREERLEPLIGVRLRLGTRGAGKWAASGGDHAKFGLDSAELLAASKLLHDEGIAHCLRMVHCHIGSQVPDITSLQDAVRESARYYAKLVQLGHPLGLLDVGGGLGVDYDGSHTAFDSSANYTLSEYARDVVYNILDVCDSERVVHPTIVTESGRAVAAHHSVLVVEAFGAIEKGAGSLPDLIPNDAPKPVRDILETVREPNDRNRLEDLHDARRIRDEARAMFGLGLLDIAGRATVETAYWHIARRTVEGYRGRRYVPEEVRELETHLAAQYICNFSVFQSLLDHWALEQLFPILPIHRLDTPPIKRAILADITCDSDGKIDKFIDLVDIRRNLPLHEIRPGEPYYLGIFLVGAYQDIMGDLHNLFGAVTEAHVFLDGDEEHNFYIEEVIEGSTIEEVLSMSQWDSRDLARKLKRQVDQAIREDRLKPKDAMNLLRRYEDQFKGYTYLRLDPDPHLATTPASNGAAAPANGPPACDPPPPPTPA